MYKFSYTFKTWHVRDSKTTNFSMTLPNWHFWGPKCPNYPMPSNTIVCTFCSMGPRVAHISNTFQHMFAKFVALDPKMSRLSNTFQMNCVHTWSPWRFSSTLQQKLGAQLVPWGPMSKFSNNFQTVVFAIDSLRPKMSKPFNPLTLLVAWVCHPPPITHFWLSGVQHVPPLSLVAAWFKNLQSL